MELQMIRDSFPLLLNAVLLHKCIQARYATSSYTYTALVKPFTTISGCGRTPNTCQSSWTRLASCSARHWSMLVLPVLARSKPHDQGNWNWYIGVVIIDTRFWISVVLCFQIMNRHPPFGNQISEAVSKVPSYTVTVEQVYNYSHCYV